MNQWTYQSRTLTSSIVIGDAHGLGNLLIRALYCRPDSLVSIQPNLLFWLLWTFGMCKLPVLAFMRARFPPLRTRMPRPVINPIHLRIKLSIFLNLLIRRLKNIFHPMCRRLPSSLGPFHDSTLLEKWPLLIVF